MKTFTDKLGTFWTVTINTAAVKRVRTLLDVNLLAVIEDQCKLLSDLTSDFVLLVDVLYCVCRPQADAQQISDEQFGERMAGDCLEPAADALLEELIDFFPDPRKRAMLSQIVGKGKAVQTKAIAAAETLLEQIDVDQLVKSAIDSATSLRPSPASSPTSGP